MNENKKGKTVELILNIFRSRNIGFMLIILAVAAWLRLWNIGNLFNAVHVYDEGVYALGGQWIAQGLVPYRDFILVHPPLHELLLAGVFKVFGYDFFYAKALSVILSLATVGAVYLIFKRMNHPLAGISAAALLAVSPDMVYYGRRVVQESLGIFLIVLAVYGITVYLERRKIFWIGFSGVCLGLAAATKFIFMPAIIGILAAFMILRAKEEIWRSVKNLGNPSFWGIYFISAAGIWLILLSLKVVLNVDIPLPFFNNISLNGPGVIANALVLLVPALVAFQKAPLKIPLRRWARATWELKSHRDAWLMIGGTLCGFLCVTGYFWLTTPNEFMAQVISLQRNRTGVEYPSFVALIRLTLFDENISKLAGIMLVLGLPVGLMALNKKDFTRIDCFIVCAGLVSFVFCQGFYQVPRYYLSVLIFIFLGISQNLFSLPPGTSLKAIVKSGNKYILMGSGGVLTIFLAVSMVLVNSLPGYDIFNNRQACADEAKTYDETFQYLKDQGAKMVFSTNPIYPALMAEIKSVPDFDTYALLWLQKKSAQDIVATAIAEGADFFIIDPWLNWWKYPQNIQTKALKTQILDKAKLVKVISPGSPSQTEIYTTRGVLQVDNLELGTD